MLSSRDIIRLLKADGWFPIGVTGRHHHFKHPTKPGKVTVPHPKKDFTAGTSCKASRNSPAFGSAEEPLPARRSGHGGRPGGEDRGMPRHAYPAFIDREIGSNREPVYGITFPDFPGCVSVGASPEEALRSGEEALSGHIAAMAADGDPLPEPKSIEDLGSLTAGTARDNGEIVYLCLVQVPMPPRSKRINVMLDEQLIEEIDAVTNNRSAFLAAAAREALGRHR